MGFPGADGEFVDVEGCEVGGGVGGSVGVGGWGGGVGGGEGWRWGGCGRVVEGVGLVGGISWLFWRGGEGRTERG